jgi:xanthine dehydrogenase YagS FAD-binding subunit
MNSFELARPTSLAQARELLLEKKGTVLKAGGIDLLDHLKEHLVEPPRVVDLKSVPGLAGIGAEPDGGLRIGPLTTLAQVADHAAVRKTHAALAQACGDAASPQIRNVATIGGNVLQRPRCWYYRLESYQCLKKGGSICYAWSGENRYHVIFGGGPSYAPHPSNAAVALVAFSASFTLEGATGRRVVPASEFFTPPTKDPKRENQLAADEILTEIHVPAAAGTKSVYAQVSERADFDWPLASVAAVVRLEGGTVRSASLVLGAVAPVPWRAKRAEEALAGKTLDEAAATAAGRGAIFGASPLRDNGYKVSLVQTLVRRTLLSLA